MDNTLVSLIILSSLLFIGFVIVLILLLKKKCKVDNDKITTLTVPFSTSVNSGLLTNVNAECYLVENDNVSYLVVPGQQNSFSYLTGTNTYSNLTSDPVDALSNYIIDNPSGKYLGYFNNCGNNHLSNWNLINGALTSTPVFNGTVVRINTNCGSAGQNITLGFGAAVIPLKKNN